VFARNDVTVFTGVISSREAVLNGESSCFGRETA